MILTFIFSAAVALARPARAEEPPLRRAVALLDYVSGDYARAVGPDGALLSAAEHQEQIGFVEDAARELASAPGGEELAKKLQALARDVAARTPPAQVAQRARALRDEIAQKFHVVILPAHAPSLDSGKRAYEQACLACHGADGHPNLALGLETTPPDLASRADMEKLSPQRVFSASTYGVPKTPMPAFDTGLTDQERWDVAFYVLTLSHPGASQQGLELARAALLPTRYQELAPLSDQELRARLAARGLDEKAQDEAVAALRAGPFSDQAPAAGPQGLAQARRGVIHAVTLANEGKKDDARRALVAAYLDHFEPHEAGLRARDAGLVTEIESGFLGVRGEIDQGKDPSDAASRLDALLERADARGPGGGFVAFLAALAIVLREGVETAFLVAAMLALLRKAGRARESHAVHAGWMSALLAGVVAWWTSGVLLSRVSGAHRELIEGVLQLLLAALILYASHWLFAAMSSRKLVSVFFQRTLAGASTAVVGGITFVAVAREMLEVVLFFRSLVLESPGAGGAVLGGAVVGLIALILLVLLFQRVEKKLKPRPLLFVCGLILTALAVLMVGNGVRSLQLQGTLPLTVWGAFQVPALGLYATREGLLSQGLVLVLLALSALRNLLDRRRS